MNKRMLYYFQSHPAVNVFSFTTDNTAFKTKELAQPHAANLQSKNKNNKSLAVITTVTRDQIMAWWATEAPKELALAEAGVTEAEQTEAAAQEVVNKFTTATPPAVKMKANLALKNATAAVLKANGILEKAQAAVDALPKAEAGKATTTTTTTTTTTVTDDAETTALTPEQLQENLKKAEEAFSNAIAAKNALAATATPLDKANATKAVNAAKKALDVAQLAVDSAAE